MGWKVSSEILAGDGDVVVVAIVVAGSAVLTGQRDGEGDIDSRIFTKNKTGTTKRFRVRY